jgi:hypothetical protein
MKSYSEKLKDPRWQKKRLEILERDNFACTICGDEKSTLHVHHTVYLSGHEPWEYNEWQLITLCEDCHQSEHSIGTDFEHILIQSIRGAGFLSDDIREIAQGFSLMDGIPHITHVYASALCYFIGHKKDFIIKEYLESLNKPNGEKIY